MADQPFERRPARLISLGILFGTVCLVFLFRLVKFQIIEGRPDKGTSAEAETVERQVRIRAVRGQIYDCKGKALVTNSYSYDMYLDYDAMPYTRPEWNRTLLDVIEALGELPDDSGAEPYKNYFFLDGVYPNLSFSPEVLDPSTEVYSHAIEHLTSDDFFAYYIKKYKKTKKDENGEYIITKNEVVGQASPDDIAGYYIKKYELGAKDSAGNDVYTDEEKTALMSIYYMLEEHTFGLGERILLCGNVALDTVTYISELRTKGVDFETKYSRVYNYPGLASHILGRIGPIYAEDWDYYNELGYPMDAIVGISGCEYAFEEYLHGTDGVMVIVEDKKGNVVDKFIKTEPVPGKDVYLTIDIELQRAAEEGLADAVKYTVESSKGEGTLTGEDCDAGAIVAVTPDGKVRAIASNPTYNLSTYSEDYSKLYEDKKMPLFNRALQGTYAPGSTFKPGMALAGLCEGSVTEGTKIFCSGVYTRFQDYQPTCWIYNMYGLQHGSDNVVDALRDSCNCYFYEVGYRLGIEKMNEYCKIYGFGEHTGIELSEKTGILAGPEYRQDNDLDRWLAGDTIAAAIGQSNNLFNPLQIAMYTGFIANNGVRYSAHLLEEVREVGSDVPVYVKQASVLSSLNAEQKYFDLVHKGMYEVINNTSVNYSNYKHFKDLNVIVAGKTGTAQVLKTDSNNALMTTYAPYDAPELIVTCLLERGNSGSNCGRAIAHVYAEYFK